MSRDAKKKTVFGVSDKFRHKPARTVTGDLKFRIKEEEKLHHASIENKGADQLCSYCTADLQLCFRLGKSPVTSGCGSLLKNIMLITSVRERKFFAPTMFFPS